MGNDLHKIAYFRDNNVYCNLGKFTFLWLVVIEERYRNGYCYFFGGGVRGVAAGHDGVEAAFAVVLVLHLAESTVGLD